MNNESIIIRRANINDIDNNLLNIFIDGFEFHLNGRKDIFDNNKKNDDLKKDLDCYINKNGLNDNIELCGNVDNIERVLECKKGFILSSKYEGMPNALMEAMAVGMPCISTDCPCCGPRELIKNDRNGILIENDNKEQLISAIINLIENKEKCKTLSNNAKREMKNYDCDIITEKWYNFMKEVCNNGKNN